MSEGWVIESGGGKLSGSYNQNTINGHKIQWVADRRGHSVAADTIPDFSDAHSDNYWWPPKEDIAVVG